jgi:hypothetical protein
MEFDHPPIHRWARLALRVMASAAAVLVCVQSVSAGGFLQGSYPMLAAHTTGAVLLFGVLFLALVPAAVLWRPGRGPARPALLCAAAVVLCGVQIVVGFTRDLIIHVPLGTALVYLVIRIALLAWRTSPPERGTAARLRTGEAGVRA